MPRVEIDHRTARAVLHAPYPLPIVITRNAPDFPPISPPPVAVIHQAPVTQPPPQTYHGFPIFNPNWKLLPPAIPPIPYPPASEAKKRNWRIRLNRRRNQALAGGHDEVELMSGIEETGPSKEFQITQQLGTWHLTDQGHYPESSGPQTNLLSSAYETMVPTSLLLSSPTFPPPAPISTPRPRLGSPFALRVVPNRAHTLDRYQNHVSSPSVKMESSDGEADEEDSMRHDSPPRIATLQSRRAHKSRRELSKIPFFGSTGLLPFALRHKARDGRRGDQTGYQSDADSTRTITRIPRGRYSRKGAGEGLYYKAPGAMRRGKEKTATLQQHSQRNKAITEQSSALASGSGSHIYQTPTATRRYVLPRSLMAFTPLSPLEESLEPKHGSPVIDDLPETPWTAQPMSIDPRSADHRNPHWPHALPQRETLTEPSRMSPVPPWSRGLRLCSASPSRPVELPFGKQCHNHLLARRVQASRRRRANRDQQNQWIDQHIRPRGGLMTQMAVDPDGVFLVSLAAGSRRIIPARLAATVASGPKYIPPDPPPRSLDPSRIDTSPTPIRNLVSIARVADPTKPPRKRRRDLSPSSAYDVAHVGPLFQLSEEHLAHTSSLILPTPSGYIPPALPSTQERTRSVDISPIPTGGRLPRRPWLRDGPAAFSTILEAANGSRTEDEEKEQQLRREAWVEGERRRMGLVDEGRKGKDGKRGHAREVGR